MVLPGGHTLPVAICVETYQYGNLDRYHLPAKTVESSASDFTKRYLLTQMIAGEIIGEKNSFQEFEDAYILNTSSKKFHNPDCSGAATILDKNKQTYTGSRDDLIAEDYSPCGTCKP